MEVDDWSWRGGTEAGGGWGDRAGPRPLLMGLAILQQEMSCFSPEGSLHGHRLEVRAPVGLIQN